MVKMYIFFLIVFSVATFGQDYNFHIPEFDCVVEINPDRSLTIEYDIFFECSPGAHSIDIVDIGFPSDDFVIGSMEAGVDNHTLTDIRYSTYIDKGVEVHLGNQSIHSGERGHFWITGINREMVFLDTEADDFASVEFSPTWFGSEYVSGSSDFSLTIIFPPGSDPEQVRYHDREFTSSTVDKEGRVVYVWEESRYVDDDFLVGVSFPEELVEGPLVLKPKEPFLSGDAIVGLSVFGFLFLFFSFIIFIIVKSLRKAKRRKQKYLPPKLGLEGSGIRRGLTAPLAALLLEEKLDKVFVLMVFGLLKKGKLQLVDDKLVKVGATEGLRIYEKRLISLIPDKPSDKPIPKKEMKELFLQMIETLDKKMKDFSLKETQAYYRSVIESAWKMVEGDNSAERAGEILGDRFQWLLADEKFDKRVKGLPSERNILLPMYMYHYFPGSTRSVGGAASGMSLSQACSQVAGSLERTASNAVSQLSSLSSAVTSKTNPVPVSTYRSSGGSSCACACACAGCACACAGGGR